MSCLRHVHYKLNFRFLVRIASLVTHSLDAFPSLMAKVSKYFSSAKQITNLTASSPVSLSLLFNSNVPRLITPCILGVFDGRHLSVSPSFPRPQIARGIASEAVAGRRESPLLIPSRRQLTPALFAPRNGALAASVTITQTKTPHRTDDRRNYGDSLDERSLRARNAALSSHVVCSFAPPGSGGSRPASDVVGDTLAPRTSDRRRLSGGK